MLVCMAMLKFFVTERHGPMTVSSASAGLNVAAPAPDCFNDWVAPSPATATSGNSGSR
jgi:hypothetical protein